MLASRHGSQACHSQVAPAWCSTASARWPGGRRTAMHMLNKAKAGPTLYKGASQLLWRAYLRAAPAAASSCSLALAKVLGAEKPTIGLQPRRKARWHVRIALCSSAMRKCTARPVHMQQTLLAAMSTWKPSEQAAKAAQKGWTVQTEGGHRAKVRWQPIPVTSRLHPRLQICPTLIRQTKMQHHHHITCWLLVPWDQQPAACLTWAHYEHLWHVGILSDAVGPHVLPSTPCTAFNSRPSWLVS